MKYEYALAYYNYELKNYIDREASCKLCNPISKEEKVYPNCNNLDEFLAQLSIEGWQIIQIIDTVSFSGTEWDYDMARVQRKVE